MRESDHHERRWTHSLQTLLMMGFLFTSGAAFAASADTPGTLPPPLRSPPEGEEMTLDLEIVVNQLATGRIVRVILRDGHYHVAARDLRASGVPAEGEDGQLIQIDTMPRVITEYDTANLRLLLTIPADWLPAQSIGRDTLYDAVPAQSSFGALVNYEAYVSDPDGGPVAASLWNEVRVFGNFGLASTTGLFRHERGRCKAFIRYDSYWRYSDEKRLLTYEAGDIITNSVPWGSVIRMGGVQVSRDFSVRPDIVTYPLPKFAGEAAVPTAVDLFIDGYRAGGGDLKPGPFTLTNVPSINGAGQAVITMTDALGRRVSSTVPFYVSSELLRKGLSDYSVASGVIRRDYGLKNFSYGSAAASGSWRYGVNDYLTLEAHAEAAQSLWLGGAGGVLRIGNAGVINASYSHSQRNARGGNQITMGYQYSGRGFNLTAQHSRRSRDFADLSSYDNRGSGYPRRSISITGSLGLKRFGSLGAGYFDTRASDGSRFRLANLSWGISPWGETSLYASANREIGRGNWSATVQLVVPLGRTRGSVSASIEQDRNRGASVRGNYNRAIPNEGGLGWNMGVAHSGRADTYVQADLAWRNRYTEVRGGVYGSGGDYTRWGSASGSVVVMDGAVFPANRINDAFVLIRASGQSGVPVRYENQMVGKTDSKGHVLVPWASAYYRGRYEIDPLDLPANVTAPSVEQRVAVRRGSGYLLDFPINKVVAARLKLVDAQGQPLPMGAAIALKGGGRTAYVGWDGLAYIEDLQAQNTLTISLPEGSTCQASFPLDMKANRITDVGAVTCR